MKKIWWFVRNLLLVHIQNDNKGVGAAFFVLPTKFRAMLGAYSDTEEDCLELHICFVMLRIY